MHRNGLSNEMIEKSLNYFFNDKNLLNQALTRKAFALEQRQKNQTCEDQEIYRVLGDAVLKAILVDLLIKAGSKTRNEITYRKKELEREETLAKIAQKMKIGTYIKLGIGEKKQQAGKEPKVLAETLEAIIGAIYLDAGYDKTKEVIAKWFADLI